MIALLASIWPFLVGAAGVIWGIFMHWRTNSKVSQAVEQTKATTENQVRQDVANETAVAATTAQAEAIQTRIDAAQQAHVAAQGGTEALDKALADRGALRDD